MGKGEKLVYLHSFRFKLDEGAKAIVDHYEWVDQNLPCKLTEKAIKLISKGFIYVHGRDYLARPCIILGVRAWEELKEHKKDKPDVDAMLTATIFTMEYIIKNMFIPG